MLLFKKISMFTAIVQNLSYVLIAFLATTEPIHLGFYIGAVFLLLSAAAMFILTIKRDQHETPNILNEATVVST